MGFEKSELPTPREKFEKAEKDIYIDQVDVETQERRRAEHIAEFKKNVKENPLYILTLIDLLPPNLDALLAKRRLRSAEKRKSELIDESHKEAKDIDQEYNELKDKVVKTGEDFKKALQGLAAFEDELEMNKGE